MMYLLRSVGSKQILRLPFGLLDNDVTIKPRCRGVMVQVWDNTCFLHWLKLLFKFLSGPLAPCELASVLVQHHQTGWCWPALWGTSQSLKIFLEKRPWVIASFVNIEPGFSSLHQTLKKKTHLHHLDISSLGIDYLKTICLWHRSE